MGCHFLLQEIFPTQGSNPISAWQEDSSPLHRWAWEALTLEGMCFNATLRGKGKNMRLNTVSGRFVKIALGWILHKPAKKQTNKTSVPKIISFWNLGLQGETDRKTECYTGRYFSKSIWREEKEQPEQVCVKSMCDSSISSGMKCWFDTRNAFDILSWSQNKFMRPGVSEIPDDLKVCLSIIPHCTWSKGLILIRYKDNHKILR